MITEIIVTKDGSHVASVVKHFLLSMHWIFILAYMKFLFLFSVHSALKHLKMLKAVYSTQIRMKENYMNANSVVNKSITGLP